MTSIRIIEPIIFRHAAPVYYQSGITTIGAMSGITENWINYLWGFQKFLKRIESVLAENAIGIFTNISCSDQLASNFYPESSASFRDINFSWSSNNNNHNAITRLWRRYYKYQPTDTSTPLYVCVEGGWKGGNANNDGVSRVTAHLSISVSTSFSDSSGLLGNINTHFFPTGYEVASSYYSYGFNYNGYLYFYCNGDDLYFSLLSLPNISKENDFHILGRTSSSYTTPNKFQRGFILAKAQVYVSGQTPTYEPVCLMPPSFSIFLDSNSNIFCLNINSLITSSMFISLSSMNYLGIKVLVDECVESVKTQGRIVAEPFTFTDLGGTYYVLHKLIRMVDTDRTTINIFEQNLNIFGVQKKIVILPMMLTLTTLNNSIYNNIGATTLGMMLDDTIIDG